MRWYAILVIFLALGCAGTEVRQSPPAEGPQVAEPQEKHQPMEPAAVKKETPPGSPVAKANYDMDRATKKVSETAEMLQRTQSGELIVNCEEDPAGAFAVISDFFNNSDFFQHDGRTFWFVTRDGKKVLLLPKNGQLKRCQCGVFGFHKQLSAFQYQGSTPVETQFYVDEKMGKMSVHYYFDDVLQKNENFVLKGH